ncbi:MAG: isocitrate lyase/phosphoenolpyruvate mutase family protein [Saprospiraceae bacterium]|nr:isocitrate lyase/phosphoenolpyruvate mutase family protein [Saprospiraceae bacterium]
MGYKAIGTTSMGISATLGYPDCQAIPYTKMVEAVTKIVESVDLPVTADIEAGYGKNLTEIVQTVEKFIASGIAGINIEDSVAVSPDLVDETEFSERISAIRKLSDSLGFHLVINARTDVFLTQSGKPENRLAEVIRRGNRYLEAGADCVFVPDVSEREKISVLVKEIQGPINILVNPTRGAGLPPPISILQDMGVARVSFGSTIMKATLALTKKIASEVMEAGTYHLLFEHLSPIAESAKAYNMATGRPNK